MSPRLTMFLNREVPPRAWLAVGLAVTFLIVASQTGWPPRDYDSYLEYANNLLRYGTIGNPPNDWITPGYPAVLAAFRLVLPENYLLFSNVALFAISSVLFLRVLREMGVVLRVWSAVLSFFLWFIHPFFIFLQTKLLSENAFIPAMMAFTLAFTRYLRSGRLIHAAGAFALLGMAVYVRPVAFYLIWPCVFPVAHFKKPLFHFAIGAAVFFVVLSPWGWRNLRVSGEFRMTSSHVLAESLLGSNNTFLLNERPDLRGTWMGVADTIKMSGDEDLKAELKRWMELHDAHRRAEQESYSKSLVIRFWRENLSELPGFALDKLRWFWHYSARHPLNRTWYYDAVGVIWYLIWLPLAAVFIARRFRDEFVFTFLTMAAYLSSVAIVTFGGVRMRIPIEFLLIAMEVAAIPFVIPSLRSGSVRDSAIVQRATETGNLAVKG